MDWPTAITASVGIMTISGGIIATIAKIAGSKEHAPCEKVKTLEEKMKIAEQKIEGSNTEIKVLKNEDNNTKQILKELKEDVSKILDFLLDRRS